MVDICNQQQKVEFPQECEALMRAACEKALSLFELHQPRVNIALVDDDYIHALNLQYRKVDRPTDVLSFAAREGEPLCNPSKRDYLGDIAISLPTAIRQAKEYGHSLERELAFLTVHGTLHLLGYDHMNPEDEKEMFALQNEIMEATGLTR